MTKIGRIYRESIAGNIREGVKAQGNIFLISYSGVSSIEMDNLRKTLKRIGAKLYVSKNSVARRTLKDLQFDTLANRLNGQMAFVWGEIDSVEVSKAIAKFAKGREGILIQGGLLQGKVLEANDVKRLSDLPSREILLAQLLGTLQSPTVRLMGALNGKAQELMSILKQFSEKK